ncbi:LpxA family transferase [Pseudomonas putida]|nr:LpxA family transferase [Pseudomonas putida]
MLDTLGDDYVRTGTVVVHRNATVEAGALVKGVAIIGPGCFIASGSLLRGGCWLGEGCIIGPGAELKTSIMFAGSKLAHFNFVGDSVLGSGVNIEAGAIIANYRNELDAPDIRLQYQGQIITLPTPKFGALVGDNCRIGANAVVAPGAILAPRTRVGRLALLDQRP